MSAALDPTEVEAVYGVARHRAVWTRQPPKVEPPVTPGVQPRRPAERRATAVGARSGHGLITPAIHVPANTYERITLIDLGEPSQHQSEMSRHMTGWPTRESIESGGVFVWHDPERDGLRFNQRMYDRGVRGVFGDAVITGPVNERGVIVGPVPDRLIEELGASIRPDPPKFNPADFGL